MSVNQNKSGIILDSPFKLISQQPLDVRSSLTTADREGLVAEGGAYPGIIVWDTDLQKLFYYSGETEGWKPIASGGDVSENYIPLTGTGTSKPATGSIWFKDCDGIKINSNNLNVKIWEVVGRTGSYASECGFCEKYLGTQSDNDNILQLHAYGYQGEDKPYQDHIVREIKQDGTVWHKTMNIFHGTSTYWTDCSSGNKPWAYGMYQWGDEFQFSKRNASDLSFVNHAWVINLQEEKNQFNYNTKFVKDVSVNDRIKLNVEGGNSTISLCHTAGTDRLRIRTSDSAASSVIEMPEDSSKLYFDINKIYLRRTVAVIPETSNSGSIGDISNYWNKMYSAEYDFPQPAGTGYNAKIGYDKHTIWFKTDTKKIKVSNTVNGDPNTYTFPNKNGTIALLDDITNAKNVVSQSSTTTGEWRKVIASRQSSSNKNAAVASNIDVVYAAKDIEMQPSTGTLSMNVVDIEHKAKIQYNSADDCVEFVFL